MKYAYLMVCAFILGILGGFAWPEHKEITFLTIILSLWLTWIFT